MVGKFVSPKPHKATSPTTTENKPASPEMKWSFAAGTNLLKNMSQKIERDSKLKLDDFAKELRSFGVVDMSGMLRIDVFLFVLHDSSLVFTNFKVGFQYQFFGSSSSWCFLVLTSFVAMVFNAVLCLPSCKIISSVPLLKDTLLNI